jgi:guanine nucleotide-binding protein subunit alpha
MPKANFTPPRPRTLSDPLAAALQPPPNESPEDRNKRIQNEIDAKRISETIDEQLQLERFERKKARPEVNVLLLGQSESGKSTTLKRECSLLCPCPAADPSSGFPSVNHITCIPWCGSISI